MTTNTASRTLALTMDRARHYSLSYFDRLKDTDLHHRFEYGGVRLNSAFWILAHLATSENGLLLGATGGPFRRFSWAKHFTVGSQSLPAEQSPSLEEVYTTLTEVHQKVMEHLPTLTDEDLKGPNTTGMSAFGPTMHDVITHAIRHEGLHAGHLSWLCKLHGIRTI